MSTTATKKYDALLDLTSREQGAARSQAYAQAMQQAPAALREAAGEVAPEAAELIFVMNYTDEGCFLMLDCCTDAHGRRFTLGPAAADPLDDIVFRITGEGETGENIPGMQATGADTFRLDLHTA